MTDKEKDTGVVFLPWIVCDTKQLAKPVTVSDKLKNKTVSTDYYELVTVRSENYID